MKRTLSNAVLLLTLFYLPISAQVTYVNTSATGANDGSSWANAYTDLQDALANTSGGEIWVAAGTYTPGTDTSAAFSIFAPVALYGGFNGTESSQADRDPQANPTFLSGDLNADDLDGDFEINRADNVSHVVYIGQFEGIASIDGFNIHGGQANLTTGADGNDPEILWRGGGLYAESTVAVSNCMFFGNAARSGGAILIQEEGANGSVISNCTFDDNYATSQSAGILMDNADAVTIEDCIFSNNATIRGSIYPLETDATVIRNCTFENNAANGTSAGIFAWQPTNMLVSSCTFRNNEATSSSCMYIDQRDLADGAAEALFRIEDCTFQDNSNPGGFSAGVYFWQPRKLEIRGSNFLNNAAANAAAAYIDQRDVAPDINSILIEDCLFSGNETTDFGGSGLYFWNSNFTLDNCEFTANEAPSSAPAIYMGGDSDNGLITNSLFSGNSSNFAGAIANYNGNSNLLIQNSTFMGNTANSGGGALSVGFLAQAFLEDCTFENNQAGYGGAVFIQNDSSALTAVGTRFIGNVSTSSSGGAILNNSGNPITIDSCYFELNTSAALGGAISLFEDSLDLTVLELRKTIFNFNVAETQGGALNISNGDAIIESCVMVNNNALNEGIGGAVSINSFVGGASEDLQVSIINSTIADNTGELIAGIANWTDGIATSTLSLQNNIFAQQFGLDYNIEDGEPSLVSNGGNLLLLDLQANFFDHPMDILGQDPLFNEDDVLNYVYTIADNSPAIDAGVENGAPATDVRGLPRVDGVDIGAYENQKTVGVRPMADFDREQLKVAPNPVKQQGTLLFDNDWNGAVELRLVDLQGRHLKTWLVHKTAGEQAFQVDATGIPAGAYKIIAAHNSQLLGAHLIKI